MIHKYKLNGFNIVLDINSGSIHVVDDIVFDILEHINPPLDKNCPKNVIDNLSDSFSKQDILDAYDEIYQLFSSDMLFSLDEYGQFTSKFTPSPIKALCLHVSHDCNLRCEYCFASTGDFGKGRKMMPVETGFKAIDFLIQHSQKRRNLEVDFFGGEPLMNMDMVKKVVEYARSKEKEYNKNFRFTMTTNGTLLKDEDIDFLNKEMHNVVLSIDGRKEVNDRVRPRVDGTGCYDSIIKKYKKLVDGRGDKDYYIRGTFTKYNLDFSKDVLHLSDYGFEQISVEPVVSSSDKSYAITYDDLPKVFEEYETLAKEIIKRRRDKNSKYFNFFHFMIDLDQGPCAIKRIRGCGSGNEYVAITPDGDIYPCHQFVGMDQWKMGNILESFDIDLAKKEFFSKTTVYDKSDCAKCWAKFYCSGGCNANNFQYQDNVLKPHHISCEMEKKRVECAIMIKAALAE